VTSSSLGLDTGLTDQMEAEADAGSLVSAFVLSQDTSAEDSGAVVGLRA
jgi:hypothetical protein